MGKIREENLLRIIMMINVNPLRYEDIGQIRGKYYLKSMHEIKMVY